jgi:hypothetical protein
MNREVRKMSMLKRSSSDSAPPNLPISQPDPKSTKIFARKLILPATLVAIAAAALYIPFNSHVLAKTAKQPEAISQATDTSNIDPDAVDAVKKMAAYLHTLKSYQIIDNVRG